MKYDIDKNFEYDNFIRIKIQKYFQYLWMNYQKENSLLMRKKTVNHRHNFLLSEHVYLSSLPQGWMTCENEQKNKKIHFKHDFSEHSFGTAKHIILNSQYFMLDLIQTKQQIERANIWKNII